MNYEYIDGEKYVTIKVKVKSINEASKGDYVEYNDKVYIFRGWSHGTYPMLEKEDGETIEIYPYY